MVCDLWTTNSYFARFILLTSCKTVIVFYIVEKPILCKQAITSDGSE